MQRRFILEIVCENSAFDERPQDEISTILRQMASRVQLYNNVEENAKWVLWDRNGNIVGAAYWEGEKP